MVAAALRRVKRLGGRGLRGGGKTTHNLSIRARTSGGRARARAGIEFIYCLCDRDTIKGSEP